MTTRHRALQLLDEVRRAFDAVQFSQRDALKRADGEQVESALERSDFDRADDWSRATRILVLVHLALTDLNRSAGARLLLARADAAIQGIQLDTVESVLVAIINAVAFVEQFLALRDRTSQVFALVMMDALCQQFEYVPDAKIGGKSVSLRGLSTSELIVVFADVRTHKGNAPALITGIATRAGLPSVTRQHVQKSLKKSASQHALVSSFAERIPIAMAELERKVGGATR